MDKESKRNNTDEDNNSPIAPGPSKEKRLDPDAPSDLAESTSHVLNDQTKSEESNEVPEPSKERLLDIETLLKPVNSSSHFIGDVENKKLNDQTKAEESDELPPPSKEKLSDLNPVNPEKSKTKENDEDNNTSIIHNTELSTEKLLTVENFSVNGSQLSSAFIQLQDFDEIGISNTDDKFDANENTTFKTTESKQNSELNNPISLNDDLTYNYKKTFADFEDEDRTLPGPYRRKRKEHLIIKDQPNIDDYELDCGERHYYHDCQYHFPKGVGKHRRFTQKEMEYTLRDWMDYIYIFLACICYLMFVLLFHITLFNYLVDSFNMTRPVVRIEQPYFSFAPVGSAKNYRLLHYNPEDKKEVKDYSMRIRKFLRKLSREQAYYKRFGSCQMSNDSFGYGTNEPCVFLKISRLIGFKTQPFEDPMQIERSSFQRKDYERLKKLLTNFTAEERKKRIWITCSDNRNAKIDIFPEPFIKSKYIDRKRLSDIQVVNEKITFHSTKDLNRVVALKISNLILKKKYTIRCNMWALNIKRNQQGYGTVYFYVIVDRSKPYQRPSHKVPDHEILF